MLSSSRSPACFAFVAAALLFCAGLAAADPIFSGPQPGEKLTAFKAVPFIGEGAGKECDPITENKGGPIAIVFLHGIERSLLPLLRVVDQYGAERKDKIRTEVVYLAADKLSGEDRGKAVAGSLKLHSRFGLSTDGAEGPGNYGLNKQCLMTIVVGKDDKATASFALVQPGFADAPKVIEALAAACGDTSPPTADALMAASSARGAGERRPERGGGRRGAMEPVDFSKLDLSSENGLRDAVRALIAEVTALRAEVTELRRAAAGAGAAGGGGGRAEGRGKQSR